jgi:hypothetical protein
MKLPFPAGLSQRRTLRALALVLVSGATAALAPARADQVPLSAKELNGGYFLLYKLAKDEDQVPILLDLKHSPPELKTFADGISKTAKDTLAALDEMKTDAPSLSFDQNALPPAEQDVRDSIKAEKQHMLLFGTKDAAFTRAFLVSQIEATTYAANIAKVLAEQESSAARARELQHLSEQWHVEQEKAYRLLNNT